MSSKILTYILFSLIVLSKTFTSAQAKKTIIIDTVTGYTSDFHSSIPIVQLVPIKGNELEVDLSFRPKIIISKNYPNIIVTELDVNDVAILLDDKGGVLRLFSLHNILSDTIKIDNWTVYKNGLTDTVRGSKAFFRMYNNSMAIEPYKIEPILCLRKNSGIKQLNSIEVSINNRHYKVPVEVITVRPLLKESFQGYFPEKKYKMFLDKKVNNKNVYRYKRFMGEETTFVQRFDARLNL